MLPFPPNCIDDFSSFYPKTLHFALKIKLATNSFLLQELKSLFLFRVLIYNLIYLSAVGLTKHIQMDKQIKELIERFNF